MQAESKRSLWFVILTHPVTIALGVAALFSIRFLNCLPFSGFTRIFNYETVSTLTSFFIYAEEPFSFPLGSIKRLAFPFADANVGNVGAIPLFAVSVKTVGQLIPYFQTFDYFISVEIFSCFLTAFFAQKILLALRVNHSAFRALGALLTGTSFLVLTRSAWLQPFCVVEFPLFTAWIYAMLLTLQRGTWRPRYDLLMVSLFPVAALADSYALFGMLLGTAALMAVEFFEAYFGDLATSRNRLFRILFLCIGGAGLSILSLYLIGMFPLPPVPKTFSSYDFGIGGRFHGADLFAPWIPVANKIYGFPEPSLLGRLGFPLNTDHLDKGQSEGVAYVGTAALILWMCIGAIWLLSLRKRFSDKLQPNKLVPSRLVLNSPWKKIGLATLFVFLFSLGYELHIFGRAFPDFSGMPAAWIADRVPSVYNIRATGRLASLMSLFLILEGIRLLYIWYTRTIACNSAVQSRRFSYLGLGILGALVTIHIFEIAPLLRPVPVQLSHPVGGIFTDREIDILRGVARGHDVALIAPSVRAVETRWTTEAFSAAYYLGLRSNLYYLARTLPEHDLRIARDIDRVLEGDWVTLLHEYGRAVFVIPADRADKLRARMQPGFQETRVGPLSVWSKR